MTSVGILRACVSLLALTCSGLDAQVTRDSAGIRIVTYPLTARPQSTWRLAASPLLEIGGAQGTGPTMFSHIWGAARTPDGGVIASDEPAQELRVFDASGRHLRTFGRRGRGPGEFSQIRGVVVYGDTVFALDDAQGTALFSLEGELIRQVPYPSLSPYHAVDPWGVLADGSVIEGAAGRETRAIINQIGTRIEMRALMRIAPGSRSATVLAIVPTYEFYRSENDPPGGDLVVFAPSMSVAVHADRVCTGRGTRYEVTCMTATGQPRLIIRREVERVRVTDAARDAYRARITTPVRSPGIEGGGISKARLEAIAARTKFAETFPAFDWIMAGKGGELWISDYRPELKTLPRGEQPAATQTVGWNVFDSVGRWIGAVDLPARFTPKDIGRDYVLGINRDDDGVERVTVYRLLR